LRIRGGEQYKVAAALVLGLIPTLESYLRASCMLAEVVLAESIQLLIELMGTFHRRSCELVLGARAIETAGLPYISARNILVAHQTMSALQRLLEHVLALIQGSPLPGRTREPDDEEEVNLRVLARVYRELNPIKQELFGNYWRRLKDDLALHVKELERKLVSVCEQTVTQHKEELVKSSRGWATGATSWEARQPSDFAISVGRSVRAVAGACKEILPDRVREGLVADIALTVGKVMTEVLSGLQPPTVGGGTITGVSGTAAGGDGEPITGTTSSAALPVGSLAFRAQQRCEARHVLDVLLGIELRGEHALQCLNELRMFARS